MLQRGAMSDYDSARRASVRPESKNMSEAEMMMEEKLRKKKEEEEEMWREYIEQRKAQRAKEDEELRRLKERQAKRRAARAEQEKAMMEYKRRSEEQRAREVEEKKIREAEAKKKRLEEAEKKRQAMQAAKEKKEMEPCKPNFNISKKDAVDMGNALGTSNLDKFANIMHARGEMGKTKEQLEEDKMTILSMRVQPLQIEGLSVDDLKKRAKDLWERIVNLESDKYDLEERQKRQDYDLKELAERQRQINRNKALKKGLDPEALSGKYPPKIQVASKYERRTDRRTYSDKKELFSGGFEAANDADLEKIWEDKMMAFKDREGPKELPKWDPENPKNKQQYDRTRNEYEDDDDDDIPVPVFKPPEDFMEPLPPAREPEPEPEPEEEEAEGGPQNSLLHCATKMTSAALAVGCDATRLVFVTRTIFLVALRSYCLDRLLKDCFSCSVAPFAWAYITSCHGV
ncbi:troponin T-like [Tropilaelaps mercedesae]|uniref:Troponin T-like n=1 Tax=Tropilaelaps mercedesae TaxID=418985 RepID=A0A1V9XWW5_9ACAR|nr:troponin T-like [Tropilaelaps mercedesae]